MCVCAEGIRYVCLCIFNSDFSKDAKNQLNTGECQHGHENEIWSTSKFVPMCMLCGDGSVILCTEALSMLVLLIFYSGCFSTGTLLIL